MIHSSEDVPEASMAWLGTTMNADHKAASPTVDIAHHDAARKSTSYQ